MKPIIVEPSVKVIFHYPKSDNQEQIFSIGFLEQVGRTCYKSEDKITYNSAERFVDMLNKRGHHAMLEHCVATVRFICDRGVTHELVRHRLASYAQESTRYCDYSKDKFENNINVIEPEGLLGDDNSPAGAIKFQDESYLPVTRKDLLKVRAALAEGDNLQADQLLERLTDIAMTEKQLWQQAMRWSNQSYQMMRTAGSPPQRARHVLPIGVKTEIVMTTNLREWMHVFRLRCSSHAHPHIRGLMLKALARFADEVPVLFDRIDLTNA